MISTPRMNHRVSPPMFFGGGHGVRATLALALLVTSMADAATLTTLASFGDANGANPYAGLTADAASNLYGTTALGGASNSGMVFKLTGSGKLSTLVSFHHCLTIVA